MGKTKRFTFTLLSEQNRGGENGMPFFNLATKEEGIVGTSYDGNIIVWKGDYFKAQELSDVLIEKVLKLKLKHTHSYVAPWLK